MVAMLRAWVREPRAPVTDEVDEALVAAARLLAGGDVDAVTGPLPERAFAHADGNLGNVVWDGERCCVVDFEDSGVSDPAYEVADLLEHRDTTATPSAAWSARPGGCSTCSEAPSIH